MFGRRFSNGITILTVFPEAQAHKMAKMDISMMIILF